MMKATGLKRGSRKKQQPPQSVMDKDDPAQRPVTVVKQPHAVQQQQPPPQQPTQLQTQENMQPRRRQNDEVTALTTKNYRLAKELVSTFSRSRTRASSDASPIHVPEHHSPPHLIFVLTFQRPTCV